VSSEHERFISDEGDELKHIREKKLAEFKGKKRQMNDGPVHVTDANFKEVIRRHPVVLIDFWAPWCGPCQTLAPTLEELTSDYAGKILVGKLDVDENPNTAECFQVLSIPTILIVKNGQEVDRIVGCVQKRIIEATLKKHLG
jgi:thioredoxin 1